MVLLALASAAAAYTAPVPVHEQTWIAPALDFPVRGIKSDVLNAVVVELTVNPYGGMSACRGRATHGNPNMGAYVCEVLKNRTTFKPARDPTGKRMWGVYRQTFVWWMSDKSMPPEKYDRFAEFLLTVDNLPPDFDAGLPIEIQFAVDTAGNASSCSPGHESKHPELAQLACARLAGRLRVPPAADRGGRAVPSVQTARVKFTVAGAAK